MADEIDPTDKAAIEKANADTIEKQKQQDINGGTVIGDKLDAVSSLDSIRDQVIFEKEGEPDGTPVVAPKKEDASPVVPDATLTPEQIEAARVKDEETVRVKKAEEDLFKGTPSLPPNASPKSSEAFSAVKMRAAQEISRLTQEAETLRKSNEELKQKASAPLTPEIEKELKELREFRIRLDVEVDPKFKGFDKTISQHQDFIYSQLKKSPNISDEIIAEIKKYGGPEKVKMDKVLDTVNDPMIRRLVESKLADIEMTHFQKEEAIKKAKSDVGAYMAEKEKEFSAIGQSHNETTRNHLNKLTAQLPWLKPVSVEATADAAVKKQAEETNNYLEKTRKEIELAIADDSPEMRATLIVGMVQLFRLQGIHDAALAKMKALEAKVKEVETTSERLKSAGKSRLKDSEAVTPGGPPTPKVNLLEPAGDALDRLRKQRLEQRAA